MFGYISVDFEVLDAADATRIPIPDTYSFKRKCRCNLCFGSRIVHDDFEVSCDSAHCTYTVTSIKVKMYVKLVESTRFHLEIEISVCLLNW